MSSKKKSSKNQAKSLPAKELQKQIDDLTLLTENLKKENEKVTSKFKVLCKKIIECVDVSEYSYIDPNAEPDLIEVNDLVHMVQRMSLLATQISSTENFDSHMESNCK